MSYQLVDNGLYAGEAIDPPVYESTCPRPCATCGGEIDLEDDPYVESSVGYICSDCPVCEVIGCNEPRAEGDEADACIYHNYTAALEDLPESFNQEAQYRVYRWRMACEKAGIKEAACQ